MSAMASDNSRFERMIAEAIAAQKAGVFARTPVDIAALAAPASPVRIFSMRQVRWHERVLVGLPVAACVAAAVGIASMWGVTTPSMTSPLASLQPSADVQAFDVRLVADCLSGPGAEVENACSAADLDSDGDVDLHDLSAYQRQSAGLQ